MQLTDYKRKLQKRNRIMEGVREVVFVLFIGGFGTVFVSQLISGNLNDMPVQYSIPDGAISGGVYEENGRRYERYQVGDKFFILDLQNGAKIAK